METQTQDALQAFKTVKRTNMVSLLTSSSTLICCALPATLVAIGAAATLTSLVSNFPQLIWISEHKPLVFILATCMLALAGLMQWRARYAACPVDSALAAACQRARKQSLLVYWASVFIFLVGVFFAFFAPYFV